MPVECLDTSQQLAVRANGDEHLRVRSDGSLEDGEGAGRELVLFELGNLVLAIVGTVRMHIRYLMTRRRWERGREEDGFRDLKKHT